MGHRRRLPGREARGTSGQQEAHDQVRVRECQYQRDWHDTGWISYPQYRDRLGPLVRCRGKPGQEGCRHPRPTVVRNLFGADDPTGQKIRIGRVPLEVIGATKPKGSTPMALTRMT